jgi:CheY-like chemotaxis protein
MAGIKNVVLAEDDNDDVEIFKAAVGPNVNIQVVRDGKELMALLDYFCPDIIFLDLEMPRMNGLQCLHEIRNRQNLKDIPIIVFSSTTRQANIQVAYDIGAHLFLVKSAVYRELANAIQAVICLDWSKPERIKHKYCNNNHYAAFS